MYIKTQNIVIRGFERKDAENLFRIVREKHIFRFMPDWAEGKMSPQDYYGYIDWQNSQQDSTNLHENKRYAIALPDTDDMIGMV